MEPDPLPDPTELSPSPEITAADIKLVVGDEKRSKRIRPLYIFSKRVVLIFAFVASVLLFAGTYFAR